MSDMKFDDVALLIADAGGGIRSEIKSILHFEGFREITETDRVPGIEGAIDEEPVDLMIIDSALPHGDVCDLTHRIRHHEIGGNPFVVVIIMSLDPTQEEIMKIIDSGADDLLLKPISAGMLKKRVLNLISARKQFVVTSDYIGPTRRKKHRQGSERIPQFVVPNPLRAKAVGSVHRCPPPSTVRLTPAARTAKSG